MDKERDKSVEQIKDIANAYEKLCTQYADMTTKCLVAVFALIGLILVTNIGWWAVWGQYDHVYESTTEYTIEQDGEGANTVITHE